MYRIALLLTLFLSAYQLQAEEWFRGGSLHKSTLGQWQLADSKNKLATASDWIVIVLGESQVEDMNSLQSKAIILVACIDTLIPVIGKSYDIGKTNTTSTAHLCITALEENGWV